MTRPKVLTTAEWDIVTAAVAYYETVIDDEMDGSGNDNRRSAAKRSTLGRAWAKLRAHRREGAL